MANNLELSQFASFVEIDDLTTDISIALENQLVGIGTTIASCELDVNGSISAIENLYIGGITTTNGPLSLGGPVEIRSNQEYIAAAATIGGGVTEIPAALTVGGDLLLLGKSFFQSAANFTGIANTFYNDLSIYGQFITTSFSQLGGPTQIVGIATFNDRVTIDSPQTPTFSTDRSNASLYVDGGVAVQRDVYIGELLDVRDLSVNELSFFYGDVGIQTNLTVIGFVRLDGDLLSNGISTFSNKVSITDTTGSTNSSTGALVVSGDVGFSSNLNIGRDLRVSGKTFINGDIIIDGSEANISSSLISLGSSSTSNISVLGLFISDLLPGGDGNFDIGSVDRRWETIRANNGIFESVDISNNFTSFGNILFGGEISITNGMDVTGITTFNSGFTAGSTAFFENVEINGTLNLGVGSSSAATGTISTALRSSSIDVESISTNADFYIGFFNTFSSGESKTVYVNSGLKYNPSIEEVTIEGDLAINGGEIRTTQANSTFDFFLENVISSKFCTTAQSLLFGNNVGVTTFKHPLVVFDGDIQVIGNGSTSSIISADGYRNIVLNSNQNTEFIGDIIINGDKFDVKNSIFYFADENVTDAFMFGDSTALYIGQSDVGFTSIRSPITIFEGDIRINGNKINSSTNTTNITLEGDTKTIFSGDIQVNSNYIRSNDGNINIELDSNLRTIISGNIQIGGDEIKSSNGETNIFLTGNTLTSVAGELRVEGEKIQSGSGVTCMTLGSNFVTFEQDIKIDGNSIRSSEGSINITLIGNSGTKLAGDLIVGGDEIRSSDDTLAITLSPISGSVGISSNLTVDNNLISKGPSTILKSNDLKVKSKLLDLGLINDILDNDNLTEPTSNENKDVGILLNYYDTQPRKASFYWDNSSSRIALASRVIESSEVLSVSSYGNVEMGGLWINDCAGQSSVISCSDGIRTLENITIDGGMY